jgi:hypothetical protein
MPSHPSPYDYYNCGGHSPPPVLQEVSSPCHTSPDPTTENTRGINESSYCDYPTSVSPVQDPQYHTSPFTSTSPSAPPRQFSSSPYLQKYDHYPNPSIPPDDVPCVSHCSCHDCTSSNPPQFQHDGHCDDDYDAPSASYSSPQTTVSSPIYGRPSRGASFSPLPLTHVVPLTMISPVAIYGPDYNPLSSIPSPYSTDSRSPSVISASSTSSMSFQPPSYIPHMSFAELTQGSIPLPNPPEPDPFMLYINSSLPLPPSPPTTAPPLEFTMGYLTETGGTVLLEVPPTPKEPQSTHFCRWCAHPFKRRHDCERHERKHTGALPYHCHGCDEGFIRADARSAHWKHNRDCEWQHDLITNGTTEWEKKCRLLGKRKAGGKQPVQRNAAKDSRKLGRPYSRKR